MFSSNVRFLCDDVEKMTQNRFIFSFSICLK
jgi:hypothetical protein